MRLIDADEAKKQIKQMQTLKPSERMLFRMALERTPTYDPPNDPLTPEQLREMDGEPVWVVELNGYPPRWGLVYWRRKNKRNIVYVTINNGASICAETFLAAGGKIYRRKPEEGQDETTGML